MSVCKALGENEAGSPVVSLPKAFEGHVKFNKSWSNGGTMESDVMRGCHGDETLYPGQGHSASFGRLNQTFTYPVMVILM